jgi:hypothetical protein
LDLNAAGTVDGAGAPRNPLIYIAAHRAAGARPTLPEQAHCYAKERKDAVTTWSLTSFCA